MKILAVGYACSPTGGSEPGVGWTAVCRIAKHHEVWVLTDIHNKGGWETGRAEGRIPSNVHVRFLREECQCSENRFIAHMQSWINYRKFNQIILREAAEWHREIGFDLCHQVTVAAWRMPSPLWQLPIPFVWGPIGGAGHIPKSFRSMLSFSARQFERARNLQTNCAIRSKAFRQCVENTAVVLAANEETETFLQQFRAEKCMIKLPVTPLPDEKRSALQGKRRSQSRIDPLRLFAGGNMEGRKGLSIALRALSIVKKSGIHFHYTIGGGGPDIPAMKSLASQLDLEKMIEFHNGYHGAEYIKILNQSDVYFLPSFRETLGMTLIEAIFAGCYPVVVNTSAQGEIVSMAGGIAVPVSSPAEVIHELAKSIIWCDSHREELFTLASASAERISDYLSTEKYDTTLKTAYAVALSNK